MKTIAMRLEHERKRLGLNQDELAELCGVHRNTQARYENGEHFPDAIYLAAAHFAGVDILYVILGNSRGAK